MEDVEDPEKIIDTVRLASIANNTIYDIQVVNLKCIPLVIFGEELQNEFKIDCDKRTISFELTGKADYPEDETKLRLEHLVQYVHKILGNYEVSVLMNKKALNGKPASKARKPNPKRKKSVRKVRKR